VRAAVDLRGCEVADNPAYDEGCSSSIAAALHGDRAVWKLLELRPGSVAEVRVPGPVPRDVDTWDDYETVLTAG
jgi:CTP:molybdopterin cytidylyltransferase MocA